MHFCVVEYVGYDEKLYSALVEIRESGRVTTANATPPRPFYREPPAMPNTAPKKQKKAKRKRETTDVKEETSSEKGEASAATQIKPEPKAEEQRESAEAAPPTNLRV